jgi:O-antigen ligase
MSKSRESVSERVTPALLSLRPAIVWGAYKAEHFAFLAICFYLFLEYVKPEQQYEIFGILPFLRLSILAAIVGVFVDKRSKFFFSILSVLLILFLLHCFASALNAYRPQIALEYINLTYFAIAVFFLITAIVNTERRLFLFVLVYFVSNLRMSEYGFFTWLKRGFSFASYGITGAGWYRNSGELGMEMAMFFAYTLCFALFLHKNWSGWVKWLMYFLPVSALACVMASSSRGAIVGVVGALFYLSLFSKQKFRAWIATGLLGYLIFLMLPQEFLARFQTAGTDHTSLSRIYYWEKAREMMEHNPVFGVGYYNWSNYFQDYYFDPEITTRVELAHNTFLQIGAELGYVGLAIFVIMVLASFYINWKTERLCREPGFEFLRSFALGMNSAGLALVLSSVFLTATYIPSYWIHFSFTACLQNIVARAVKKKALKRVYW